MGPLNLNDYETLARERLPEMVYDYYAGGAGDELTLNPNPPMDRDGRREDSGRG